MARRSRAYSFNNKTKRLFLSGTVVAKTNESNVATVSGLLDSNTQSNITTVGTLDSVTSTGNIETTSGFFLGNGSQLTGLSSTVKTYVDNEISGLVDSAPETLDTLNEIAAALGDDPNLATTLTTTITTANTAMKGYVDGEITSVDSAITTANLAMVGYVDNAVSTANTAVVGYVDDAVSTANTAVVGYVDNSVTTANTAMKGYVDSEIASVPPGYADSDVADYLPTYSGNVAADFVNANFFTGNGSQLTGLPAGYSDADVDAHLSGGTGVTYSSGTISIGQAVGTGDSPTFSTLDLSGTTFKMTSTSPRIEFDDVGNSGQGEKKITCNDGGGNWNFRGGVYYSGGYVYETTGDGGADMVMNFEGSAGTIYWRVFPTGTAGATASASNSLTFNASGLALNTGVFSGTATQAQYADLAEKYISDKDYAPGTVVVFGGPYEITESTQTHQRSIAGVISTKPAYLMNSDEDGLAVALQGRVPCQVLGPIRKGDLVVASEHPGIAQRLNDAMYRPGCVIGKALNDIETAEVVNIEVVVGRL